MRKVLLLLLIPSLCFGQTFTVPISSPLNGTGITLFMGVTPIDGSGNLITGMKQDFPSSSSFPSTVTFNFPATAPDYTLSGFEVDLVSKGTGWTQKEIVHFDSTFPVRTISAGTIVQAVVNFPLTSAGSVVVTLVPPPPPVVTQPIAVASPVGACTAPASVSGCAAPLPQLIDSTGGVWTLIKGVPTLNGKPTNNVYSPNIRYLFVNVGGQIRSQNGNGTYACWLGTAWGC